jgi:hypothetical protein
MVAFPCIKFALLHAPFLYNLFAMLDACSNGNILLQQIFQLTACLILLKLQLLYLIVILNRLKHDKKLDGSLKSAIQVNKIEELIWNILDN